MHILIVLQIVDKMLEIHLERLKNMPVDQKAEYWQRFERRMDFWEGIADKVLKIAPVASNG